MEVEFRTRRLERCYLLLANAVRAWGDVVGRRYVERVRLIASLNSFDELHAFPGLRVHELRGSRAGQYAVVLTGQWRLIVERLTDDAILVVEVSNHYGD